jgi:hypothetical protein
MFAHNRYDVENLINNGEKEIEFSINPEYLNRLRLKLKKDTIKGVELFAVRQDGISGLIFMYQFKDMINFAIGKGYKVFVFRERNIPGWYLKFVK